MRVVPDGVRRAVGGFPFPLEPGGGNTSFSEPLFNLLSWDEDHKYRLLEKLLDIGSEEAMIFTTEEVGLFLPTNGNVPFTVPFREKDQIVQIVTHK